MSWPLRSPTCYILRSSFLESIEPAPLPNRLRMTNVTASAQPAAPASRWLVIGSLTAPLLLFGNAVGGPLAALLPLLLAIFFFRKMPIVLLTTYLTILIFQNLLICLLLPIVHTRADLVLLQGTQFLTLFALALLAVVDLSRHVSTAGIARIYYAILTCLAVAIIYLLFGIPSTGLQNSAISFRTLTVAPLSILFGIYVGRQTKPGIFLPVILAFLTVSLVYGLLELVAPRHLYSALNADYYFSIKSGRTERFSSVSGLMEWAHRNPFNLRALGGMGFNAVRLSGPNLHPISYAYSLAIALMLFATERAYIRVCAAALLLIFIQAKGPTITICFAGLFVAIDRLLHVRTRILAIVIGLAAYIGFVFWFGIAKLDYHILGFLGGVAELPTHPIGHGLGAGGNLIAQEPEWKTFQAQGRAAFGTESAIGVMAYQLGLFALVFITTYLLVFRRSLTWFREMQCSLLIPYAFLVMCINGLFQEEAYGPFALGLAGLILGLYLGHFDASYARTEKDSVSQAAV
jgi:hypothetical protein